MRSLIAVAIVGLGLAAGIESTAVSAQGTLEDKVKAAIVAKFPQFIEWPAAALSGRSAIDLCIVAADPIQLEFEQLAAGETVAGRPLTIRPIQRDQEVDACHVLFLRAAAVPAHRAMLRRASSLPVLTVSDDPSFLDAGGIVRLRQVDGRLRFEINAAAARTVGLRISSQLLQLAPVVRGGQE